ncbi:MAG: WecB/TagA/CpsF family glycosyltransferase, partial [Candidatus Roizmanbacteria bacterium]
PELKILLNKANITLPDGVGLVAAARLLDLPIKRRIAGVDFMEKLLSVVANRPVKSGFFGGQKGVAVEAANCLQKSYQNLQISYASHAYNGDELKKAGIDILFVGLGFPKQEEWILEHRDEIDAKVIMAVGGAFDFLSRNVVRAPKVVQDVGAEWLFRLIRQPWRARRQAQLLNFSALILGRALSDRLKRH